MNFHTDERITLGPGVLIAENGKVLCEVNQPKKHKPPLRCILRRAIVGASPSAMFTRCALGLWRTCKLCKDCSANRHEAWTENFQKGLEEGLRAPRIGIDLAKGPDFALRLGNYDVIKRADGSAGRPVSTDTVREVAHEIFNENKEADK